MSRKIGIRLYQRTTEDLDDPAVFDAYFEQMPQMRQEKILRLRNREDQKRSLAAGILLYQGLADLGVESSGLRIATEEHGRPWLPDFPEIHFSLSHSGERALAVFSECGVGCDIEEAKEPNRKVVKRFFCPEEQEWVLQGNPEEVRERFYRLWVLKESFLKATGRGLSLPMDAFCFSFEPSPCVRQTLDAARYSFKEYAISAAGDISDKSSYRNCCADPAIQIAPLPRLLSQAAAAASDKSYYAAVCLRQPDESGKYGLTGASSGF